MNIIMWRSCTHVRVNVMIRQGLLQRTAVLRRSLVMPAVSDERPPLPINGKSSFIERLFGFLPSWKPSSEEMLEKAEKKLLKEIKSDYQDSYVPISSDAVIRTLTMESSSGGSNLPLVMIHGFGAGLLQFYKNLDHLHTDRRLHALDLPGFGRSTRKQFPLNPAHAELEYVNNIETWRKALGIEKFILLGHSFGGFLACAYTLRHPSRVRHLILVDPWGVAQPPSEEELKEKYNTRSVFWRALGMFKPFTLVRAAGPWGPDIIKRVRGDLGRTFGDNFLDYVYHCNAQRPTGESAYYSMQYYFVWAKQPMLTRLQSQLDHSVPITVISGGRSWMHMGQTEVRTPDKIAQDRPHSYVDVHYVRDAGHHVHADKPVEFNTIVRQVFSIVDSDQDLFKQKTETLDSTS